MLFFLHINKTGGTSVRHALLDALPEDQVLDLYTMAGDWRRVEQELDRTPARIAVGHVPYATSLRADIEYATILRDPLDRVRSIYAHHRTNPGAELYERLRAEDIDLLSFIERNITPGADNWMTRLLAGLRGYVLKPVCEATYEEAADNLRRFALVGVTPSLPDFLDRLGDRLGVSLRRDLRINATEYRSTAELTQAERDAILDRNRYDMRLYELAETLRAKGPSSD